MAEQPGVESGPQSGGAAGPRSSPVHEHFSRTEMDGRAAARPGMERWRDRLALVTGASGGIGAAVARALVQEGLKVVGCARTVSNIEELAAECKSAGYPGTLIPYRCDLASEEDILSMFSAVRAQHGGVDICINNAGLARPDSLLAGSTSGWKDMFNVNVLALSICTREAYQSMRERKVDDGHIININSMSGHRVAPQSMTHFYSATKYAVTALTEGLRQELRDAQTHIRATCISPGLVETQFAFKLHDKDPEKAAATYENIKCLKPEDVAEAVIYVLSAPPHVQVSLTPIVRPPPPLGEPGIPKEEASRGSQGWAARAPQPHASRRSETSR
ncbi:dehydrogenase/reductase SDR family member 11 isoform X1 [Sorex araneus]|uniref:dehydrogenase/reductase SDR family member 11 isoform X1 n=1 Tax=Sorex araneus TaxID=42254 RepID=UPI002433493E|nr:dehydrogenase/reductase SDR family member 11 isoform X1 [Sorex araneus]